MILSDVGHLRRSLSSSPLRSLTSMAEGVSGLKRSTTSMPFWSRCGDDKPACRIDMATDPFTKVEALACTQIRLIDFVRGFGGGS